MGQVQITRVNVGFGQICGYKKKKCKGEVYWFVGKLPLCDKHLRLFCKVAKIDYDSIVKETKENMGR